MESKEKELSTKKTAGNNATKKSTQVKKESVKKVAKKPTVTKAKTQGATTSKTTTKKVASSTKTKQVASQKAKNTAKTVKKVSTSKTTPVKKSVKKADIEKKDNIVLTTEKPQEKEITRLEISDQKVVNITNKTNVVKEEVNKQTNENLQKVEAVKQDNKKIKVLYVVSECHPFCATGGLADVAEGLPKYINNNSDIDMRVVLPMYSDIPSVYREKFKFLGYKYVPVAWRNVYCGVFTYSLNGVTYYFLDNEYYFKRGGGIYSYYDDGERFAFTSRAVLELISLMDFIPNIIHCNDWQSALIPIYLKTIYVNNPYYNKIKTVFTLHNTEYQGKFDIKIISDLFGIDAKYTSLLEYNKDLNLVKGAICCCDKFTTVSPTYAQEILTPEHSNGLDPILRQNAYKICGILNAIDCDFYNPKTDNVLYKNYDVKTMQDKCENKLAIQKELGLEVNKDIPMMCIVTRMAKHKGLDLIKTCMENIVANRPIQFVAVGGGDREYEDYFRYLQGKYPSKVKALLGYSNVWGRKAYGASDIFLMPSKSEPCGISQMIASRYGAIPIVRETGGLKDSMWDFGCPNGGNAYTFRNYNTGDLVYSITRALNDYSNKADWQNKMKICMLRDFSWKVSANGYISIYNELSK